MNFSDIQALDVILTSGFLGTLIATLAKWKHDRKKMPLDREAILSSASQQNVDSALAIAAEARANTQAVKEQLQEEAKRERERHKHEMQSIIDRLTRIENQNTELAEHIIELKADEERKNYRLAAQDVRIGRLELKLQSARQTVHELLSYIKEHIHDTGEIPAIDLSIFDLK